MKTVKKYTTFEALKSNKKKTAELEMSLKKHNEFERTIKAIYAIKAHKSIGRNPK